MVQNYCVSKPLVFVIFKFILSKKKKYGMHFREPQVLYDMTAVKHVTTNFITVNTSQLTISCVGWKGEGLLNYFLNYCIICLFI